MGKRTEWKRKERKEEEEQKKGGKDNMGDERERKGMIRKGNKRKTGRRGEQLSFCRLE